MDHLYLIKWKTMCILHTAKGVFMHDDKSVISKNELVAHGVEYSTAIVFDVRILLQNHLIVTEVHPSHGFPSASDNRSNYSGNGRRFPQLPTESGKKRTMNVG